MPRSRRQREARDPLADYVGFNIELNTNIRGDNCPRVLFKINLFRCPCNTRWSEWESPLINAEDGELCDNPDCSGNDPIMPYDMIRGRTSCQVPQQRVFGSFKCHKCLRLWFTAHSWANKAQKCESCLIRIYPFAQDDLGRPSHNRKKKHQEELCDMCQDLQQDCSKYKPASGRRRRSRRYRNGNQDQNIVARMNALVIAE